MMIVDSCGANTYGIGHASDTKTMGENVFSWYCRTAVIVHCRGYLNNQSHSLNQNKPSMTMIIL
jgi:hypothetical protein